MTELSPLQYSILVVALGMYIESVPETDVSGFAACARQLFNVVDGTDKTYSGMHLIERYSDD